MGTKTGPETESITDALDLIIKTESICDFLNSSIKNPGLSAILLQCQEDLGEAARLLAEYPLFKVDSTAETV